MNNKNLKSLINLYGGQEDPNKYTSSLLSKYTNINDKTLIKITNLKTLVIDNERDSPTKNKSINIFEENDIIKIENLNNIIT